MHGALGVGELFPQLNESVIDSINNVIKCVYLRSKHFLKVVEHELAKRIFNMLKYVAYDGWSFFDTKKLVSPATPRTTDLPLVSESSIGARDLASSSD